MSSPTIHFMKYGMTACMKPGVPGDWPADHLWENEWTHVNCPDCMKGRSGEALETFVISPDGKSITCLRCKRTSYNATDVEVHYCGKCRVSHDDIWPPARHWWVTHPDPDPVRPPLKRPE